MKSVILFWSSHCPECPAVREGLDAAGIKRAEIDVTSGMTPLKQFLKYRDHDPHFAEVRESGRVGVPSIVVNKGEEVYFGLPEDLDVLR